MKKSIKTKLIIIVLALVVCLAGIVWFGSRRDDPFVLNAADASRGPGFEVLVEKPRMDRFLGGILPTRVEAALLGGELRFNQASPGARIGSVGHNRLELGADGWELLIETDDQGRVTPGTRLVFPIEIAEKLWTLRCRPADPAKGYLHSTTRPGSDVLDSRFLVEIARCEDARTGEILDTEAGGNPGDAWPSSPLTLSGRFQGVPPG